MPCILLCCVLPLARQRPCHTMVRATHCVVAMFSALSADDAAGLCWRALPCSSPQKLHLATLILQSEAPQQAAAWPQPCQAACAGRRRSQPRQTCDSAPQRPRAAVAAPALSMQLGHDDRCRSLRLTPLAATQSRACRWTQKCAPWTLTQADGPLILLQNVASVHCSAADAAPVRQDVAALEQETPAPPDAAATGCPAAERPPQPCALPSLPRSRPAPHSQARPRLHQHCRPCRERLRRLCFAECRLLLAD